MVHADDELRRIKHCSQTCDPVDPIHKTSQIPVDSNVERTLCKQHTPQLQHPLSHRNYADTQNQHRTYLLTETSCQLTYYCQSTTHQLLAGWPRGIQPIAYSTTTFQQSLKFLFDTTTDTEALQDIKCNTVFTDMLWSAKIVLWTIFLPTIITTRLSTSILEIGSLQCFNTVRAPCRLRGCKNWPAPFPGRMSYKATKPGLVSVLYLNMRYNYGIVVY